MRHTHVDIDTHVWTEQSRAFSYSSNPDLILITLAVSAVDRCRQTNIQDADNNFRPHLFDGIFNETETVIPWFFYQKYDDRKCLFICEGLEVEQ